MILKKIGKIGGDDSRVRSRLKLILSKINPEIEFRIVSFRIKGSGPSPPIYEVCFSLFFVF